MWTTCSAAVPQILNYQGKIAVGSTPFTGAGKFRFALVDAAGTTTYWSNDGTSAAGSQPAAAVSLPVVNGLYVAPLGDTSIANMSAVPVAVFANDDVRLRVWFDDGVNGAQKLAPDQRVTSVAYALVAGTIPDGTITASKIAPGAVGAAQIAAGTIGPAQLSSGALSYTRPEAGGVARSVFDRLREVISVKDFGAVGDGVADDSAKIQAALTAVGPNGGTVYLPTGIYRLTVPVNVPYNNVRLIGAGGANTILKQTVNGASGLTFTTNVQRVVVEAIKVLGPGHASSTAPGIATPFSVDNINEFAFRDVTVEEFNIGGDFNCISNGVFENCSFGHNGTGGMRVYGNANSVTYLGCNWVSNSGYGLKLEGGFGHVVVTGDFGGPLQQGGQVIVAGPISCVIQGCNMEVYGGTAIQNDAEGSTLLLSNVKVLNFGGNLGYSLSTGNNETVIQLSGLGIASASGASIKQGAGFGARINVSGQQCLVDVYVDGVLRGGYKTHPLVPLTEILPSGAPASAAYAGYVRRRMDTGLLETWDTPMRKADGSYEYVSLTPLRSANTWTLPQTWSAPGIFNNGLAVTGVASATAGLKSGATGLIYWDARASIKSPADGQLALRNNADTADANLTLGSLTATGEVNLPKTITAAGTRGAQTINKPTGSVNFAPGANSLQVNNSLVTANSTIIATVAANDGAMTSVKVVAAAGFFTLYGNAAPILETRVNFLVFN